MQRIIVPFYTERNDYKILLNKSVENAFKSLTGRNRVRKEDEKALSELDIDLMHVDKLVEKATA